MEGQNGLWRTSTEPMTQTLSRSEDDWDTFSTVKWDMQDEDGQRHEKMLGSGSFKSFNIAESGGALRRMVLNIQSRGQP